jgi:hypothetical protein
MLRTRANRFFPGRQARARGLAVALALVLTSPAFAQDTGVSGIPPGPANVNGLNGSVRDPSGIGNAARMPPLPQQITPVPVPSATPQASAPPVYGQRAPIRYDRRWQHLSKRQRQKLERAAVKENNRLLGHGLTSICRGC